MGVSPYVYNLSNELTSKPGTAYTYDNNGNLLSKDDAGGTTSYVWDPENRLTSVTLPGSGEPVSFQYDPFGRRIYKASPSGTTIFVYDGINVIEEVSADGSLVALYTHGLGIDDPLAMLRGNTMRYYLADGLGSVTSLTDAKGNLTSTYQYDSFGNLTASTGSIFNPFRYTGREFDTETGLYFYRARYYDPSIGRFISEDPIRFGGGINFYRYCLNNPVNLIDSLGLSPACELGCVLLGTARTGITVHIISGVDALIGGLLSKVRMPAIANLSATAAVAGVSGMSQYWGAEKLANSISGPIVDCINKCREEDRNPC